MPEKPDGTLLAVVPDMVKTMLRLKPAKGLRPLISPGGAPRLVASVFFGALCAPRRQRAVLTDKVPDMANIVAGAIVIGFAIGDPRASWPLLMAGLGFWAGALLLVLSIAEDRS